MYSLDQENSAVGVGARWSCQFWRDQPDVRVRICATRDNFNSLSLFSQTIRDYSGTILIECYLLEQTLLPLL